MFIYLYFFIGDFKSWQEFLFVDIRKLAFVRVFSFKEALWLWFFLFYRLWGLNIWKSQNFAHQERIKMCSTRLLCTFGPCKATLSTALSLQLAHDIDRNQIQTSWHFFLSHHKHSKSFNSISWTSFRLLESDLWFLIANDFAVLRILHF